MPDSESLSQPTDDISWDLDAGYASLGSRRSPFQLFPGKNLSKTDHAKSWKVRSLERESISSSSGEATGTSKFQKIAKFFRQKKLTRSRRKSNLQLDVVDDNWISSDADVNRNSLCDNLSVISNQQPGEEASFKKEDGVDEEDTADEEDNVDEEGNVGEEDKDTVQGGDPSKCTVSDVVEVIPVLESNCTFNGNGGDDEAEGRKSEEGDGKGKDVAECNTSNQVETEGKPVKFSTSGEDTNEDVEESSGEDVEEDKENNINETDVVEDSVEDAPTFANVSTSSGSDGDDDKDDENDRDKNSREYEEEDAMDTEVKISQLIRELRKLLQQALDDRSVHHDFDVELPEGWTIRIEENKVEIVEKETGLPSECYMEFPTISEFRSFSNTLYQAKYSSSPKDPYKEEGPPIAHSNSSHLLDLPVTESDTESLVPSSVESDDLGSIQNTEGEEDVPECITSSGVETEHIWISDEDSGEDVGEDKEADKQDDKETVTGLLTFDEVDNVKGKKSEEWDKDGASDTGVSCCRHPEHM